MPVEFMIALAFFVGGCLGHLRGFTAGYKKRGEEWVYRCPPFVAVTLRVMQRRASLLRLQYPEGGDPHTFHGIVTIQQYIRTLIHDVDRVNREQRSK